MLIRREEARDVTAIADVHARAFEDGRESAQPVEVRLVDELRRSAWWLPRLSLVAVVADEVVGHVVCSRAVIEPLEAPVLGLGPIGVLPRHQGHGVGSALMHAVLGAADACHEPLVALLGEPAYYGRFGFVPAGRLGIEAPDPGWGDYFQVRAWAAHRADLHGRFRYAPPFSAL